MGAGVGTINKTRPPWLRGQGGALLLGGPMGLGLSLPQDPSVSFSLERE
jgi:hypothetical protein